MESFIEASSRLGWVIEDYRTLSVILPVGISFYTFQTMSYSLDVYKGKLIPTKNFIAFAAFVSFFPQLVAGPIERASNLLPQLLKKREFGYEQAAQGLRLILWGLFKKVAIADALAPIVDDIFLNHTNYSSSTLLMGAIFFGFQIYGDFSGYSDIAIGTAKLFGIELMSNFKFPYFSRNIGEFWRRWHISLSTWFRDYLYIPLGGSQGPVKKVIRNVTIVFLVSGFWHGANWTFIVWGAIHVILFVPLFLFGRNRRYYQTDFAHGRIYPKIGEFFAAATTFLVVSLTWIYFRAPSIEEANTYFTRLFTNLEFSVYAHPFGYRLVDYFILLIIFVIYEYRIRKDERNPIPFKRASVRFLAYGMMILGLLLFYDTNVDMSFIYFQF